MEELEYDDFTEQLKKINEKIEELENTDRLQEYLQLQKQASALQKNIYKPLDKLNICGIINS